MWMLFGYSVVSVSCVAEAQVQIYERIVAYMLCMCGYAYKNECSASIIDNKSTIYDRKHN